MTSPPSSNETIGMPSYSSGTITTTSVEPELASRVVGRANMSLKTVDLIARTLLWTRKRNTSVARTTLPSDNHSEGCFLGDIFDILPSSDAFKDVPLYER